MKNKKLGKSLGKFYEKKEDVQELLYGELGIPINGVKKVDVPGRAGYVYVRLRGNASELVQAYNSTVPSKYDYPVIVSRKKSTYSILGRDQGKFGNMGNSGNAVTTSGYTPLPNHGGQHSFNPDLGMGADPTWVYSRQFMSNLVYPSGTSMMLTVNPAFYEWNGQWKYTQPSGTPDLRPYVPTATGSARMVLLYADGNTGAIKVVGGVGFSGGINNNSELAPFIPDVDRNTSIPLAAVKLGTGTTSIDWSNIYDMRDFYTVPKGFNGIGIQDSGIAAGTGTILNFGTNLTVSMAGGVATIDATAGGGGSAILAQNKGVLLGTGTIFNFVGDGVTASISGTVFNINIPSSGGSSGTGTATYLRVGQPTPLSSVTGTYWKTPEPYVTGSLAVFNQGHVLIPSTDYAEQYPQSGTYQYTLAQETGTYHLSIYGVLAGGQSQQSSSSSSPFVVQDEGAYVATGTVLNFVGGGVDASVSGSVVRIFITGSSAVSAGGRTLIEEKTPYATGTFAFTGIPATYKKLTIEYSARATNADSYSDLYFYFNNDKTAGNYQHIRNYAYGLTSSGIDTTCLLLIPGATAPAGAFGTGGAEVIQYTNNFSFKEIRGDGMAYRDTSSIRLIHVWGASEWKNTGTVNQIDVAVGAGLFVSGSVFRLYGES